MKQHKNNRHLKQIADGQQFYGTNLIYKKQDEKTTIVFAQKSAGEEQNSGRQSKQRDLDENNETTQFWQRLLEQNEDVVGYITIHGTAIDYPVVHSKDNEEYLKLGFDKKKDARGSIFIDYECKPMQQGYQNLIVYGHNMRDKSMFGSLSAYLDEEYYQLHPIIYYFHEDKDILTYVIFSVFIADATPLSALDKDYRQIIFESEDKWSEWLNYYKDAAIYDTGVSVADCRQVMTLSTCTNSDPDKRLVIIAKLIE